VHVHARAWRNILGALALVALALPATSQLASTPAHAQAAAPPASIAGAGTATPAVAFNPIGSPHTTTFTCTSTAAGGFPGGAGPGAATPGCWDLTASVSDATSGGSAALTSGQCGGSSADVTTATLNCAGVFSPLRDSTMLAPGQTVAQTMASVTINPGSPHVYYTNFTFYTLAATTATIVAPATTPTSASACPGGGTFIPGPFTLEMNGFAPPTAVPVTVPEGVCQYTVSAQKKYVEITGVQLTGTGPCAAGAGPSSILYSEGLKAFFGTPCTVTAAATGTVVIKTGVNCAAGGGEPATGTVAPADFQVGGTGTAATYSCTGDTLSVVNIQSGLFAPGGLPVTLNISGPLGPTGGVVTFNGGCAGTPASSVAAITGVPVTLCPTGAGSGTISGAFAGSTLNTQPPVATSNTLTFTFTLPAAGRLVPYVRWAGEKAVLTKCFGGGGTFGGAAVEFTLENQSPANATLIPVVAPDVASGTTGSSTTSADSTTVWTVADASGCASVIVYARADGIVNVDAAIFGTSVGGTGVGVPLLNEHAFTVYYLRFDHVDLENIVSQGYSTAATLTPSLTFGGSVPAAFPARPIALPANYSLPNPPGTGQVAGPAPYSVALCSPDLVRAMVHGYFEIPGQPSGRPATNVAISGAPTGAPTSGFSSVGSYVLPAGRWVLPDDWPVLATFAGYNGTAPIQNSTPGVQDPSNVLAWDLNSGFVFNPSAGERAVIQTGPANPPATVQTGAITNVALGSAFSTDADGTNYATAGSTIASPNCVGSDGNPGLTIGIGPFDATQACTTTYHGSVIASPPFPLPGPTETNPAGSGVLTSAVGAGGAVAFSFVALGPNSTYLPNGVLNQWDAPMPPAQVSFGITNSGATAFLGEVNKSGLYSIDLGSAALQGLTAAQLAAGAKVNPVLYPDPFYAEAIPASPLIPPLTNNGGYLWNSWGFSGGMVVGVTPAAAMVAGESTALSTGTFGPAVCPTGTAVDVAPGCTYGGGAPFVATVTFTSATCTALGGTFNAAGEPAGSCTVPTLATRAPAAAGTGTVPGGTSTSDFGGACPVAAGLPATLATQVNVANIGFFKAGQTVSAYSNTTGATLAAGLVLTAVTPIGASGTGTLTFGATAQPPAAGICIPAGTAVFTSESVSVPVPTGTAGSFPAGKGVSLFTPGGSFAGTFVATDAAAGTGNITQTSGANTYVDLAGAEAVVRALGGCVESRGAVGGPVVFGTCEPATLIPTGTLLTTAPAIAGGGAPITTAPANPYPFWQWVPNASPASPARPQTATVYSDNHGEAVVSLQTGITTSVAPVAGVCPTGYSAAPTAAAPTVCLLNLSALASAGAPGFGPFANITAALGKFSASAPGCLDTTPTGGNSVSTGATAAVGANGPASGQICVNTLGALELGPNATLGSTTVQAVADYPYTRGDSPAIASATLTKVWTSSFNKSVSVSAPVAGPSGTGTTTYTVTITANDVCGQPLTGEPVQVYAVGNAGAVVLAPLFGGTALGTSNATVVLGTGGAPAGTATLSLEVLNAALGNNGLLIKAVFPLEGIERFVTVIPGTTTGNTVQVIYTPGYNMVGGPSNSNFSSAEAVFSYDNASNSYTNVTASAANLSSAAPACTGYFAYFAAASAVNLPATSKPGDTATCTLPAGWSLIGNPFASPATLPSGTTAYHFNGSTYDAVGSIPVGGAVYIFNSGAASTITLTAS
jgi:hypothetical protein